LLQAYTKYNGRAVHILAEVLYSYRKWQKWDLFHFQAAVDFPCTSGTLRPGERDSSRIERKKNFWQLDHPLETSANIYNRAIYLAQLTYDFH